MNEAYAIDGLTKFSKRTMAYKGAAFETRAKLYEARRYEDGMLMFFINSQRVDSLPDTLGARKAFEKMLDVNR